MAYLYPEVILIFGNCSRIDSTRIVGDGLVCTIEYSQEIAIFAEVKIKSSAELRIFCLAMSPVTFYLRIRQADEIVHKVGFSARL